MTVFSRPLRPARAPSSGPAPHEVRNNQEAPATLALYVPLPPCMMSAMTGCVWIVHGFAVVNKVWVEKGSLKLWTQSSRLLQMDLPGQVVTQLVTTLCVSLACNWRARFHLASPSQRNPTFHLIAARQRWRCRY